jgi:glycosyltransferase involved in cell wall biosynthesis
MAPPMRVAHISVVHRPLDIRIFEKECVTLAAAGYDVHLIVAGPPAPQIDGVRFHSIANDPDRPPARRQLGRLGRAARCAIKLRPATYHLHDPHLIPLGLMLKLYGATVIYDVHEDYPQHARSKLVAHPLRGRLKAIIWATLEGLARRAFDGFVCASPELAEKFPGTSTTVVHNFPVHRRFPDAGAAGPLRPYRERDNTLIYTGNIREIRGFWEMAQALETLPAELECRLRMVGGFRSAELAEAARRLPAWSRMELIPWQRPSVVWRELLHARIGLVLLHPLPNHDDPMRSNKLFEYMAAGIPVIASALPRWRELVRELGCGIAVDPLDPVAIGAAIEHLLKHPEEAEAMGRRGKAAVWREFNWDREAPRLLSLYRALGGDGIVPRSPAAAKSRLATLPGERRMGAAAPRAPDERTASW